MDRRVRILLVDDDDTARGGLEVLLRLEGFVVATARDGEAALAEIDRDRPDVVLTDLKMPIVDGIELCRRVRAGDRHLPVVVLTASHDMDSAVEAIRAGADDYLTKPIDLDAAVGAVGRAIEKHAADLERAQLLRRTEELYERAQAAVKRREEVVSIIAHDLRSHLGVATLAAQALETIAPTTPTAALAVRHGAMIRRAAQRMNCIIENVLEDTRLQTGNVTLSSDRCLVGDLLDDVRELRPVALQRGVGLDVAAVPEDWSVNCDRSRIGQVMANLVSNAVRFSPRKTSVEVSVDARGGEFVFAVRDRGPGIAADSLPHLFERYWKADSERLAGTGLGLYIAKGVVDAHGGRIWCESRPAEGSTFFFALRDAASASKDESLAAVKPQTEANLLTAYRYREAKGASAPRLAFDPDAAAMGLHDASANR